MITGYVFDSTNKETLLGANVYFTDAAGNISKPSAGIPTDADGYYEISNSGEYLTASSVGFKKQTLAVLFNQDRINFYLSPDVQSLSEIDVTAKRVVIQPVRKPVSLKKILIITGSAITAIVISALLIKR